MSKKQVAAGQPPALFEQDGVELAIGAHQPLDTIFDESHAVARKLTLLFRLQAGGAIGAEHQVVAPDGHGTRHLKGADATAVNGDGLVAGFPRIAVRTMVHAAPVQVSMPCEFGQIVDDACGQQQLAAARRAPAVERDQKRRGNAAGN